MKCRTCDIGMTVERRESDSHAVTEWHVCPACRQTRMTSEPCRPGVGQDAGSGVARQAASRAERRDEESLAAQDHHPLNYPYAIQ